MEYMEGPGKDKNPYKKVDSSVSDKIRKYLPVPGNVAQMIAKLAGDSRMSESSLSDAQKLIMYDVIQKAMKRSGSKNGGTEYEDYGDMGYGTKDQFNQWFNRGKLNALDIAKESMTNEGFKLASTVGRGRYWSDEKDPDALYYTDVYDWNPNEKNFSGKNTYQDLRNVLRAGEDKNLNKDKNEKNRMNFKLSKKEIESIRRNMKLRLAETGD